MKVIDVHIHVGHLFEWTENAKKVWMEMGPYKKDLYDNGLQNSRKYGEIIKKEGIFAGILIPEYSPATAGIQPFERAQEITLYHPEFVCFANVNPNYHKNVMKALSEQIEKGAKGLKIHPVHGLFYANDKRLYPLYEFCEAKGLPVFFHAGTSLMGGARMKYADPYTFDDVRVDFPKLKIILCHGGRGFFYHIAEFMVKNFDSVYIDISGLPPRNLLKYFPDMKKYYRKFLFGTDFPGVPGISKNLNELKKTLIEEPIFEHIVFSNAYNLFDFWKEGIFELYDSEEIMDVINDGAKMLRGFIPEALYREPFISEDELEAEMKNVKFYGFRKDLKVLGVLGWEEREDVVLLKHLYVKRQFHRLGIGSKLLSFLVKIPRGKTIFIATWKDAYFSGNLFKKYGFMEREDSKDLLKRYWKFRKNEADSLMVLSLSVEGGHFS